MDLTLFGLFCLGVSIYLLIQALRLVITDCDLTLQWYTWFGKSPKILKGKTAWITGASSGIGECVAYEMSLAGCKLILSARREKELERVKNTCIENYGATREDILVLPLDVTDFDSHEAAMETVLKYYKKLDILLVNAGATQRGYCKNTSVEVDKQILNLNFLGCISVTKVVLPHMISRKSGNIAVMSSLAGKIGMPMSGAYSASKFALQGWYDSLRTEVCHDNISVTTICPGPVFSNLLEHAFTEKAGQLYGRSWKSTERRMSTKRCAQLTVIAIVNRVMETWVSQNPALVMCYVAQYFPDCSKTILKFVDKLILKKRDGDTEKKEK